MEGSSPFLLRPFPSPPFSPPSFLLIPGTEPRAGAERARGEEKGAAPRGRREPGKGREGEPRAGGEPESSARPPDPFQPSQCPPPHFQASPQDPSRCASLAFCLLLVLLCGLSLGSQRHLGCHEPWGAQRGPAKGACKRGGGGQRPGPGGRRWERECWRRGLEGAAWGRPSRPLEPGPRARSEARSRRPQTPRRAASKCACSGARLGGFERWGRKPPLGSSSPASLLSEAFGSSLASAAKSGDFEERQTSRFSLPPPPPSQRGCCRAPDARISALGAPLSGAAPGGKGWPLN